MGVRRTVRDRLYTCYEKVVYIGVIEEFKLMLALNAEMVEVERKEMVKEFQLWERMMLMKALLRYMQRPCELWIDDGGTDMRSREHETQLCT
jgi:hypothetical protein